MQNTIETPHYNHPLVTWSSTLMGSAIAIVTSVMLNALGAALGFATVAATQTSNGAAAAGYASIAWMVASNLFALACGAWVAARSAQHSDHHRGNLQGIAVWAVTSLFIVFVASSTVAGAANTAAQSAAVASSATMAQENAQGNLENRAQTAANNAQAQIDQNRPVLEDETAKAAAIASATAFGTFLSMLLGLLASVMGARSGAKHPQWTNRPRYTSTDNRTGPTNMRNAA